MKELSFRIYIKLGEKIIVKLHIKVKRKLPIFTIYYIYGENEKLFFLRHFYSIYNFLSYNDYLLINPVVRTNIIYCTKYTESVFMKRKIPVLFSLYIFMICSYF